MSHFPETTKTTLATESHRGHTLSVVESHTPAYTVPAHTVRGIGGRPDWDCDAIDYPARTRRMGAVDGRVVIGSLTGTDADSLALLRKHVDGLIADAELRPTLVQLIDAAKDARKLSELDHMPTVGGVVYVHAMGYFRRGLVIKTTAKRVTVAYTTASSEGRVFRKAVALAEVRV